MSDYPHGTLVEWDWGAGSAKGKVDEKFTEEVIRTIKGAEVKRNQG